jgi:cysteinyl-tRNA synthetase
MSKSLGNVLNIRDILKTVHPEALRLFLLTSHYRSPLDYSESSVKERSAALERLYTALAALGELMKAGGTSKELPEELSHLSDKFAEAMDDDFNTPKALAVLFDAARAINRISSTASGSGEIPQPGLLASVKEEIDYIADKVLGILTEEPARFLENLRKAGVGELGLTETRIQELIAERAAARKSKDFARADAIRDELVSHGILLEDTANGAIWKVKDA